MADEKITRKELKSPDEFISFAARALDWIQNNWKMVSAAVGGLIVIIILVQLFVWFSENKEKEASQRLVEALSEVMGQKNAAFFAAPTTAADPEKVQKALSALEKLEQQYSSARTSKLARYFRGELLRRQGKYDEAIKSFSDFIAYYGEDNEFSCYAMEGIGASLEAQGKLKEALSQYQKLERNSYNVEPDRAIYHQGRVQLQLGDTEKARELFRNLLDKYPESSLRQEVQNRLAFLELQKQAATPEEGKADGNKAPDGGKG
jgi:tetratricopeptide (TPR) repeat protein